MNVLRRYAIPIATIALAGSIVRLPPVGAHEALTTTVIFDREIVRILDQHCVVCHADGALAFPLETYEQTWLRGREIRAHALDRRMPPWSAMSGYGEFANDNHLTLRELQFLVSWVEGSGPRSAPTVFLNVASDAGRPPAPIRARPEFGLWRLGDPPASITLAPVTVASRSAARSERRILDTGLRQDARLTALEYHPGDRRVVRAATFSVQETGQWVGSWTPWYGVTTVPENHAFRLPAGGHLVADVYYRGVNDEVTDRGTVGLFLADRPMAPVATDLVLNAQAAPAGDSSTRLHAEVRLTEPAHIFALRPEFSGSVQSVEVKWRAADGSTGVLLYLADIAHDWPTPYVLKRPTLLTAGSVLSVTAYAARGDHAGSPAVRLTVSRY